MSFQNNFQAKFNSFLKQRFKKINKKSSIFFQQELTAPLRELSTRVGECSTRVGECSTRTRECSTRTRECSTRTRECSTRTRESSTRTRECSTRTWVEHSPTQADNTSQQANSAEAISALSNHRTRSGLREEKKTRTFLPAFFCSNLPIKTILRYQPFWFWRFSGL